jgi:MOSC domain-containing protein YiiM
MDPVERVELCDAKGLVDCADQGGKRQVTILDAERWSEIAAGLGVDLDSAIRRANLLVRGVELEKSRGKILRIGSCTLRIHGETTPCERMEEAHAGLQDAMRPRWGGGVYAGVIEGGLLEIGDEVELTD